MKLFYHFIIIFILFFIIKCEEEEETDEDEWSSECERTKNPSSIDECINKSTEFIYERCCYLYGMENRSRINKSECVDVTKDDIINAEVLNQTRNMIFNGTYWDSYTDPYISIEIFRCFSKYNEPKFFFILILLTQVVGDIL